MRSSTTDLEGSPQSDAVRKIVRPIGFPTRATNSPQTLSPPRSAQLQTKSLKDSVEYSVGKGLFPILTMQLRHGSIFVRSLPLLELLSNVVMFEVPGARRGTAGFDDGK